MSTPTIPEPALSPDGTLSLSVWVQKGNRIVQRDALDLDDPDHPVNVIERLGENPDYYGYREARLARDKMRSVDFRLPPN